VDEMELGSLTGNSLDVLGQCIRWHRPWRQDVDGRVVGAPSEGDRRHPHITGRLGRRDVRTGDQAGDPSPSDLEQLIDRELALVSLEWVSRRQPGLLPSVLEQADISEPGVELR